MQGPQCNRENLQGVNFCGKCGAKLARTCPQCGAELPLDAEARFCFQCGAEWQPASETEVAPPEVIAERLQRLVPKEYAERLP